MKIFNLNQLEIASKDFIIQRKNCLLFVFVSFSFLFINEITGDETVRAKKFFKFRRIHTIQKNTREHATSFSTYYQIYVTYVAIVYTGNNIVNKFIRVRCDIYIYK